MNDWIEKHSVNCYFCAELVDGRECMPADPYNGADGGSICPECQKTKPFRPTGKNTNCLEE